MYDSFLIEKPKHLVASRRQARTLAVLQPGFLPWLGFFDQVLSSDVFILYDDVQFDKNGWRNRNRIKAPTGPLWLTVPVCVEFGQSILDVRVDNSKNWARKQIATIEQLYARSEHRDLYLPKLEQLLLKDWDRLVDLDIALIDELCHWLGITTPRIRSSQLQVEGERSERLLKFCMQFKAERYLSGVAAKSYLDVDLFTRNGIEVVWQEYEHPVYTQLHGEFVSHLSAIDLLLNCGPGSGKILAGSDNRSVRAV